jgi:ABC-2 type transport system permease protein
MTIREFVALVDRDLRRWIRTPTAIISSLLLPFFYLLLFGQSFNISSLLPGGGSASNPVVTATFLGAPDYYSYFSAGMVGFVLLSTSLFSGANVIFDRRFGVLKKITSSPAPREVIFGARVTGGVIRGLLYGGFVFLIALVFAHLPGVSGLTVTASIGVVGVVEILLAMVLLTAMFTAIFVAMGFMTQQIDTYFALINLVNLPVLFTSNALFLRTLLPGWLRTISDWNPVSLAIDVLRENLFAAAPAYYAEPAWIYLAVLAAITLLFGVLTTLAVRWSLRPR